MKEKWALIEDGIGVEDWQHGAAELGFEKQTLTRGKSRGVEVVKVSCGSVVATIVPTRGMGLAEMWVNEKRIGWRSPIRGPVHPSWVPLNEPSGLGWLDGFDELMTRCGLVSNGAPEFDDQNQLRYGLHGRIANLPADFVEVEMDSQNQSIRVIGITEEARFHFHRWEMTSIYDFSFTENSITVTDVVKNLSGRRSNMQMLYHWNFGRPLLQENAKLFVPAQRIGPRNQNAAAALDRWNVYDPPTAGFEEQVYFMELLADEADQTVALLTDSQEQNGVALEFSRRQLPCFTLWKNTVAEQDGYVTGLEPGLNFPNPTSFEQKHGRTVALDPGESHQMITKLSVCNASKIAELKTKVEQLQTAPAVLERQPVKEWTCE